MSARGRVAILAGYGTLGDNTLSGNGPTFLDMQGYKACRAHSWLLHGQNASCPFHDQQLPEVELPIRSEAWYRNRAANTLCTPRRELSRRDREA